MKQVLEFVTALKQGPTAETLLEMLGQPGVSPEAIEQVCERLRQQAFPSFHAKCKHIFSEI
jgi:hypothetical protein